MSRRERVRARARTAAMGAALTTVLAGMSKPAASQDLSVRLWDRLTLEPYVLLQLDGAGFRQGKGGGQAAGLNARRLRVGSRGAIGDDFEFGLIWDFGGGPGEPGRLFEAKASYVGLQPLRVTAGAFKTNFSLEGMQGAGDYLFLERASIVTVARNLGAGVGRTGVEIGAGGDRYNASVALTAGQAGPGRDGGQRAIVSRVVGLPVRTDEVTLHLGVSGQWVFEVARGNDESRTLSFSDQTEIQIDDVRPALATPDIPARRAGTIGSEVGLAWRRLWAQGEYHRLLVDRTNGAAGNRVVFDGWYVQAAYTLLGEPRRWESSSGAWSAPKPANPFNPATGDLGAVEIGLRYGTIDLNQGDVQGGRQNVTTVGVNWWPTQIVRLSLQYQHGRVVGGDGPRNFDAVGVRAQLQF